MIPEMERDQKSRSPFILRKSGTLSVLDGGEKVSRVGPMFQKRKLLRSQAGRTGNSSGFLEVGERVKHSNSQLLRYTRSVQSKPVNVLRLRLKY